MALVGSTFLGAARAVTQVGLLGGSRRGHRDNIADSYRLRPLLDSRRFGWTHYGVMVPNLPEPHRYLSLMVMRGRPGLAAFDVDGPGVSAPREVCTVSVSTAAGSFYRIGSASRDFRLSPDGSELHFGDEVRVRIARPRVEVRIATPELAGSVRYDLQPRAASWFVRIPGYHHLSLPGQLTGRLTAAGTTVDLEGNGTFEYARCVGTNSLGLGRPMPALPVDFFTYHVIDVPGFGLALFARVGMAGELLGEFLDLRSYSGHPSERTSHVPGFGGSPVEFAADTGADGAVSGFTIDSPGRITVRGHVDTPLRVGVGHGHILGYRAEITTADTTLHSRGYAEYVDVRHR